jgi:hypothetical protein
MSFYCWTLCPCSIGHYVRLTPWTLCLYPLDIMSILLNGHNVQLAQLDIMSVFTPWTLCLYPKDIMSLPKRHYVFTQKTLCLYPKDIMSLPKRHYVFTQKTLCLYPKDIMSLPKRHYVPAASEKFVNKSEIGHYVHP